MHNDLEALLAPVTDIAVRAGAKILEIYETDFEVETKDDESPLTAADIDFLAAETKTTASYVTEYLDDHRTSAG